MHFPTLFEFSAKSVAEGVHNETISIPFLLDAKCSDVIFKELLSINPNYYFKILEDSKNNLSITKIDMRCSEDLDMRHLSAFNLVSLSLKNIENLYDQFADNDNYPVIDIASALKVALNENSRKDLAHLGITGKERFPKNWAREISKLLPSLQSIDISRRKFNKWSRFPNFCMHFPNIRVLDISSSTIQSLKGIKSLQNLEVLKMCNIDIGHSKGFNELSRLKKLRYLDVSNTEDLSDIERVMPRLGVMEKMLDAGVEMKQLLFIDCSQTAVTPMELQRFAQKHSNLETAVVMETLAQDVEIIGVNLFNYSTAYSLLKSLSLSISTKKSFFIQKCLRRLITSLNVNFDIYERDELDDCLKMMLSILDEHEFDDGLKGMAVRALSKMFKTENLDKWSFLEIEIVLRRLFKKCKAMKKTIYTNIINDSIIITDGVLNSITVGKLLPDSLLDVIFLETLNAVTKNSEVFVNGYRIWERLLIHKMSWEQFKSACENVKYINAVVEMMAILLAENKWTYYGRSVDFLNFMLASESSKWKIVDTDVHMKIMRQFKTLHTSNNELQSKLLRIVLFFHRYSFSYRNLL
ncbi:hypothetical protein GCK72_004877 [Caenorhabditis remanei]|uniref:Uncharacterized protein n=1 Tax=Caenorhabditis remanei TaxID=31234 RepID=A0A6A5HDM3_CAERE|nr:hypothetical protein GCK72_004877 [Caenorhabditis remanei]KAF1764926.1 hypothetical protein GCK72_004877 [Caenorhabditis remanei]